MRGVLNSDSTEESKYLLDISVSVGYSHNDRMKYLKIEVMKKAVLGALAFVFVLASCNSSQKKREELSSIGEVYQNTTAKFNGYFNARELWDASKAELNQSYNYNYNQLLPVFPYMKNEAYLNYKEDMDKIMEKLATVISKHPSSDWVDDSYLLLAKALFIKKDYEQSVKTLEYLTTKYSPGYLEKIENVKVKPEKDKKKRKKRRKKKEKDEGPQVKRYTSIDQYEVYDGRVVDKIPAFYEALLWIAQTYTASGNFIFAELALDRFEKYNLPNRITMQQYPIRAYWNLERRQYTQASEELRKAIETSTDNYAKARYAFIRGQLAMGNKEYQAAQLAFEDCINFNPVYEMVFAAQIKLIEIRALVNENPEKVQKSLEQMLDDGKNVDYFDQIYFAMARLAMESGDLVQAEKYFRKSIQNSTGDENQLAEAYFQLAEMNYKRQDYLDAKYYFDSTLMFMTKTDDRYFYVESNSDNLKEIAENIEIIQLNDSLLNLMDLSDKERRDFAYEIQQQKEAAKNRPDGSIKSRLGGSRYQSQQAATGNSTSKDSKFFAYDEKLSKKGEKNFERIWGDIALQDFWRISSLNQNNFSENEEIEQYEALVLTDEDVDRILDFIPESPEEVDKLEQEIAEAMYQLGVLYRDKLEQYKKAISVHEELLDNYPGNQRELETFFYLYLSYQDLGETVKSDKYKQLILQKYPETNYAKALENPDLLKAALNKEERVKSYYDEVYDEFQKENYELAYEKIQARESKFDMSTTYASKFDLLGAMCVGRMRGRSEYIRSLREVIGRHRGTEESKRAKEILDILGLYTDDSIEGENEDKSEEGNEDQKELDLVQHDFKYNPDMMHYVVVSYNSSSVTVNQAKIAFSNFNNKFFRLERLKVSNIFLDTSGETPLLTIRKFQDAKKAKDYVNTLIEKYDDVLGGKSFTTYPISQINYRELIRIKSVDTYEKFYREKYIR